MSQQQVKDKFANKERLNHIRARFGYDQATFDLILRTKCQEACRHEDDVELCLYKAKALEMDPLLDEIHFVARFDNQKRGDEWVKIQVEPTIQVGIGGFRLAAARSNEYAGNDAPVFHYVPEGVGEVKEGPVYPPGAQPIACTVTVYRAHGGDFGRRTPYSATCFLKDYVQMKGRGSDRVPTKMWEKVGVMLPKCSEAAAFRKAFPKELSRAYLPEEFQADESAKLAAALEAATEKPEAPKAGPPKTASEAALVENRPADPPLNREEAADAAAASNAKDAPAALQRDQEAEKAPLSVKDKAAACVGALKDRHKDKASSVFKAFIARKAGATTYEQVKAEERGKVIDTAYLVLAESGPAGLVEIVEGDSK